MYQNCNPLKIKEKTRGSRLWTELWASVSCQYPVCVFPLQHKLHCCPCWLLRICSKSFCLLGSIQKTVWILNVPLRWRSNKSALRFSHCPAALDSQPLIRTLQVKSHPLSQKYQISSLTFWLFSSFSVVVWTAVYSPLHSWKTLLSPFQI